MDALRPQRLAHNVNEPMLKSELQPKTLKQAIAAGLRNDWNGHERTVLGKELTPTLTVVRDG